MVLNYASVFEKEIWSCVIRDRLFFLTQDMVILNTREEERERESTNNKRVWDLDSFEVARIDQSKKVVEKMGGCIWF